MTVVCFGIHDGVRTAHTDVERDGPEADKIPTIDKITRFLPESPGLRIFSAVFGQSFTGGIRGLAWWCCTRPSHISQPTMASTSQCMAGMARLSLASSARPTASTIPRFLVPSVAQTRCASVGPKKTEKKKRKLPKDYKTYNIKGCPQFSLCDAVRYVSRHLSSRKFVANIAPTAISAPSRSASRPRRSSTSSTSTSRLRATATSSRTASASRTPSSRTSASASSARRAPPSPSRPCKRAPSSRARRPSSRPSATATSPSTSSSATSTARPRSTRPTSAACSAPRASCPTAA